MYCAGAELLASYPLSVVTDGVGLNITVFSYRDHVDFGITADRASIEDAWPLMDAIETELHELRTAIPATPPKPARPAS